MQALQTVLQSEVDLVGAGRTDAGVHAEKMFAHFDIYPGVADNFVSKLNAILPDDIVVNDCFEVAPDLHARFDAVSRSYQYRIYLGRNPFLLDTTYQLHRQTLDIDQMNKAAAVLLQYSDFECFSKVKTDVKTFQCNVTKAEWVINGQFLTFRISANRFLRNMVRAIVGTLLEVGKNKMTLDEFNAVIESKKRSNAGVSVPAKGLFLTAVKYNF